MNQPAILEINRKLLAGMRKEAGIAAGTWQQVHFLLAGEGTLC